MIKITTQDGWLLLGAIRAVLDDAGHEFCQESGRTKELKELGEWIADALKPSSPDPRSCHRCQGGCEICDFQ